MAICVAVIGKNNQPLYLKCKNEENTLFLNYKVFAALDVIDDRLKIENPSTANYPSDLYLGMLYAFETFKIYGYVTNTNIKFIIVVDSKNLGLRDNEIKIMFRKLHSLYIDALFNPFCLPNKEIVSRSFDYNINNILTNKVT